MTKRADLIIRNALLRDLTDEPMDIAIAYGKIVEVSANLDFTTVTEIDADKKLVTESFANPHLHLCKVWTLDKINEGVWIKMTVFSNFNTSRSLHFNSKTGMRRGKC